MLKFIKFKDDGPSQTYSNPFDTEIIQFILAFKSVRLDLPVASFSFILNRMYSLDTTVYIYIEKEKTAEDEKQQKGRRQRDGTRKCKTWRFVS